MRNFLLISLVLLPMLSIAQLWDKSFDKNVNLIKMTDAGVAVVGTDDALYGINAGGEVLWRNEKLKKVEENRVEILSGSELIFVSDKGMLSRNRTINVLTGKEYADTGVKFENIFAATIAHSVNQLWVYMGNNTVDAWDIDKNEKLWTLNAWFPHDISLPQSAALTNTFSGAQPIVYTSKTTGILHLGLGQLGEFNFDTGEPIWQADFKPFKTKPDKGDVASMPVNGFSVMKLTPDGQTLYFPFREELLAIDAKSGAFKWEAKANKTGKVRDMYITDQGILVLTYNGVQLINAQTGAEIWKKPIKLKGAGESLFLKDGADYYAVSKNSLVKIDIHNASSTVLNEKIKFDYNDGFSSLQVHDDQLMLIGSQNVVGIDKNTGQVRYHQAFKAPGASLVTIAQNVALAAVAAAATYNSQRLGQQNANALGGYSHFSYTPALMTSGGPNSTEGDQYMYISTKFKEADATGFGLAKIDKFEGEVMEKIVIGDRDPVYAVNEREKLIFYRAGKKSIACRKMN